MAKKRKHKKKPITKFSFKKISAITGAFILALAGIFAFLNDGLSVMDRLPKPTPKEIVIEDSSLGFHYVKHSKASFRERIDFALKAQTYLVNVLGDSIALSSFKIENDEIVNTDSLTARSIFMVPKGYGEEGYADGSSVFSANLSFAGYFSFLPSIENIKPGKIIDLGYVILTVPYIVNGVRKVKEQKFPITLEVK